MMAIQQQIEKLRHNTVDFVNEEILLEKLKRGKPLRIKVGLDPTSPDIHLGHTVVLQKLRTFQELGHHIIFLVGDFTARIGDPTGRNETRPQLSEEAILQNAKTYTEQAFKILDPKKTEVRFNSEWLGKMSAVDMIKLASHYTVARMLERDDFKKRFQSNQPIAVHEFLYPLLQGYDSVELKSDVELGGTDQIFNLLVGRELQKDFGQEQQVVITLPLLVGLDGVQKMSKSYNNYVGVSESPREQFGKLMSVSDELMWMYYKMLTPRNDVEIQRLRADVESGVLHPKKVKEDLAEEIVSRFHDAELAKAAREEFQHIFTQKGKPEDMPVFTASADETLYKIITSSNLTKSGSEFRRLVSQGGVKLNDQKVQDVEMKLSPGEHVIQVGKRVFARITVA